MSEQPSRPSGTISDETIERLQRRIGIPSQHLGMRTHVTVTTEDSIRHFAMGIGLDDALYCDPEYAANTPWGGVIAPPLYFSATGAPKPFEWTAEQKEAMSGGDPLGGIGQYMIGEKWTFHKPVRPGDQVIQSQSLHRVQERPRADDGRRALWVTHRVLQQDRKDDSLFADMERTFHHADRNKSGAGGHSDAAPLEPTYYDEAALAEIDAGYAAEVTRGAELRSAKDVSVGDSIGRIVRGPLLTGDVLAYHVGIGFGGFGSGSTRIAYRRRQRVPKLFVPNDQGVPDTVQRCHWEDDWARQLGQPLSYDYGAMRSNWATTLIHNWMGDTGWLWKFESRIRRFNLRGDATWFSGEVTEVDADTGRVEVEIQGINQRGTQTCTATATILLPLPGEDLPTIPEPEFD